jgi:hypothetical protein
MRSGNDASIPVAYGSNCSTPYAVAGSRGTELEKRERAASLAARSNDYYLATGGKSNRDLP